MSVRVDSSRELSFAARRADSLSTGIMPDDRTLVPPVGVRDDVRIYLERSLSRYNARDRCSGRSVRSRR